MGLPGEPGQPGELPSMDGGPELPDAGAERDSAPEPPPEGGLAGTVRDGAGRLVSSGRVVLVPASGVRELAQRPFDLALSPQEVVEANWDEPLEDQADDANGLASAQLNERGEYRFASVSNGSYFVLFVPSPDDAEHLPGGDPVRVPRDAETLRNARLDLTVSSAASRDARYVGSTPCLTCHGRHTTLSSAHALTLRAPGVSSPFQDLTRAPRIQEALSAFDAGTTLYFYDCSPGAPAGPTCTVRDEAPADSASVRLVAALGRNASVPLGTPGAYVVDLSTSVGGPAARYEVVLTVGGIMSYQQFVVRSALPGGGYTHFLLPLKYQLLGDDGRDSPHDYRWAADGVEHWLDLSTGNARTPANEQAFERQCAGCHTTGLTLFGDDATGFRASAAPERDGVYDLDGDGRVELLAVGCESCHGPGSRHIEASPRGQFIVSPQRLTPERQTMLCGGCHSNPRGVHGELAPLDEDGRMPLPGLRRAEIAARHVSRMDAAEADLFPSGDSRHPWQQYTDFVRSPKYRNENLLVSCTDCHDPHSGAGRVADLTFESADDDACSGCHQRPDDIHAHASERTGYAHERGVDQEALSCVGCHLPQTATAGARVPGILDLTPASAAPVRYYQGDRSSHRFAYTGAEHAAEQPIAATQACAFCHGEFLQNP